VDRFHHSFFGGPNKQISILFSPGLAGAVGVPSSGLRWCGWHQRVLDVGRKAGRNSGPSLDISGELGKVAWVASAFPSWIEDKKIIEQSQYLVSKRTDPGMEVGPGLFSSARRRSKPRSISSEGQTAAGMIFLGRRVDLGGFWGSPNAAHAQVLMFISIYFYLRIWVLTKDQENDIADSAFFLDVDLREDLRFILLMLSLMFPRFSHLPVLLARSRSVRWRWHTGQGWRRNFRALQVDFHGGNGQNPPGVRFTVAEMVDHFSSWWEPRWFWTGWRL
jgi:hypothetical protein